MPLTAYVARRLLQMIPTLVVLITAVFFFLRLAPGDPAEQMLGLYATEEAIANLRRELGLDLPLWQQYANFWSAALHGDLGVSYRTEEPVFKAITAAFTYTVQLAVAAMALAVAVGIPLGVWAAVTRFELVDRFLTALASVALSLPVYWIGLLAMLFFSITLGWLPASGAGTWKHLIMPACVLATGPMANVMRLVRSQMLEVLEQPFIAAARAKGVSERRLVFAHALRNALLPVITQIGLQFGNMLGGAVLTETVFAWPGLGRLVTSAVYARDYPVIQACVITLALIYMVTNLAVDVAYAQIDPRVEYR